MRPLTASGPRRAQTAEAAVLPAATRAGGSCPVPDRMQPSTVPGYLHR